MKFSFSNDILRDIYYSLFYLDFEILNTFPWISCLKLLIFNLCSEKSFLYIVNYDKIEHQAKNELTCTK